MTALNEATEAQLEARLAELRAKSAEPQDLLTRYDKAVAESYRMAGYHTGHGVGKVAPYRARAAQAQNVAEARKAVVDALAPRPAEAMDDAAGRWPSDAELRDMAEDVGDTLEPALEMARLVREWQTGGAAKPEYGKVHADGSRSGGQPVSEPEWIDWHGGECPVSAGTRVTVEYHNGTLGHREGTSMRHDDWRIPGHIRRYRILGGVA
jgi:hypothetical protein